MNDLDDIFQPDAPGARDRFGVPSLVLGPAVLRMVMRGRDIEAELDALVTAVGILQGTRGFMHDFVYEMAADMAQAVEGAGTRGVAEAVRAHLDPGEKALAFQIALVAVFSAPGGSDDDIGVLSAIADRVGVSDEDFSEAYDSARAAVAGA